MAYEAVSRAIVPSRRRTCCGSLTSYVCPRHRIVVGRRVRRRPAVITHGTAIAATAVRHAGTFQAPATAGAAEKRARRRKKAFATETRRSFRTAQEPPHANERRGSNSTFALTAFHSARTRDQNVGRGGRYQRKPVATPTVESARGCTSCRSQSGGGRMSESANTTTSSSGRRWARADRSALTFPRSRLASERIVALAT